MIRLVGRKLLFGSDEEYLGTTYDENTGKRTFIRDRRSPDSQDLSTLSFYVLMNYQDGTVDMQDLEKSVTDDEITLIWNLSDTIFKHEGHCFIWVRALDEQKVTRWSSEKAVVYITDAGSGDFSPSAADSETLEKIIKAETARAEAETKRAAAETAREDAETARGNAETKREVAENGRADAEEERKQAEILRKAAENDRADAESLRTETELKRIDSEDKRVSEENSRAEAEAARIEAENLRKQEEEDREKAETERVNAETARVQEETAREQSFKDSEEEFENTKTELKGYAKTSESWAIGGTGTRDGEDTDNSKYYSSLAKASEESAASSAESAKTNMETVQSLTTLVIPEFKMSNNRIYMTEDGTDRFLLLNNRIYVKRIEVA